jgi:hypothetical protein
MVKQQRLHAALRDFAHTLVHRYEIGEVLYRLGDDVTDVLGTTGSGVSLIERPANFGSSPRPVRPSRKRSGCRIGSAKDPAGARRQRRR